MWFYIIPAGVIFVSLAAIGVVVARKFSLLKTIDITRIPKLRQTLLKRDITEQRLLRTVSGARKNVRKAAGPFISTIIHFARAMHARLLEKERYYRERAQGKIAPTAATASTEQIRKLVEDGEVALKEGDYAIAEKKFIEVISLDHTNVDAYHGLGEVYLDQGNEEFALKSIDHALKLDPENAELFNDMGSIYEKQGVVKKARQYVDRAVKKEPNNPKYLDHLIAVSIACKDRYAAHTAWKKLKEVNPENTKLQEYEKQIEEM